MIYRQLYQWLHVNKLFAQSVCLLVCPFLDFKNKLFYDQVFIGSQKNRVYIKISDFCDSVCNKILNIFFQQIYGNVLKIDLALMSWILLCLLIQCCHNVFFISVDIPLFTKAQISGHFQVKSFCNLTYFSSFFSTFPNFTSFFRNSTREWHLCISVNTQCNFDLFPTCLKSGVYRSGIAYLD